MSAGSSNVCRISFEWIKKKPVRVASRLLAWWSRARALRNHENGEPENRGIALDDFVELRKDCTPREAAENIRTRYYPGSAAKLPRAMRRRPILVGRLLLQQWPSARARRPPPAALPAPPTSSAAAVWGPLLEEVFSSQRFLSL